MIVQALAREDLTVKWSFEMIKDPIVLTGHVSRKDGVGGSLSVEIQVPLSVFDKLPAKERTRAIIIDLAEERLELDLEELNGTGGFENVLMDSDVQEMRKILALDKVG